MFTSFDNFTSLRSVKSSIQKRIAIPIIFYSFKRIYLIKIISEKFGKDTPINQNLRKFMRLTRNYSKKMKNQVILSIGGVFHLFFGFFALWTSSIFHISGSLSLGPSRSTLSSRLGFSLSK